MSTEVELLEAAQGEGKATVAAGVTIELTKPLFVKEKPSDSDRESKHCERPPLLLRSAGCGGGWG